MREFFYYTKAERIGIVVLLLICVCLFVLPSFLPDRASDGTTDFTELEEVIANWELEEESATPQEAEAPMTDQVQAFNPNQATQADLQAAQLPERTIRAWLSYTSKGGRWSKAQDLENFRALSAEDFARIRPYLRFPNTAASSTSVVAESFSLFPFDPNTVTENELISLGVPPKVAGTWMKYTTNGGRFREARDIERVYGLSDQTLERLLPYVQLAAISEERMPFKEDASDEPRPTARLNIDVNQASVEEWQQLRGIGPKLSSRIVRFRDKLGGFISVAQVGETYGLPDSTFQSIQPQLSTSAILRPLAINRLDKQGLGSHPYLSYQEAEVLINYRQKHGAFQSVDDLRQVLALKKETLEKITPYLDFD